MRLCALHPSPPPCTCVRCVCCVYACAHPFPPGVLFGCCVVMRACMCAQCICAVPFHVCDRQFARLYACVLWLPFVFKSDPVHFKAYLSSPPFLWLWPLHYPLAASVPLPQLPSFCGGFALPGALTTPLPFCGGLVLATSPLLLNSITFPRVLASPLLLFPSGFGLCVRSSYAAPCTGFPPNLL